MKFYPLKKNVDERGSFTEIFRQDWVGLLHDEWGDPLGMILQANYAFRKAGTIVAWHLHTRSQYDFFIFLSGKAILAEKMSDGTINKIEIDATDGPKVMVEVDGSIMHGFKALTDVTLVYLVNNLYDYQNPDEGRFPAEDKEFQ